MIVIRLVNMINATYSYTYFVVFKRSSPFSIFRPWVEKKNVAGHEANFVEYYECRLQLLVVLTFSLVLLRNL
jgi:hypothetical protein